MKYLSLLFVVLAINTVNAQYERLPLDKYCSIDAIPLDDKFIYPLEASEEAKAILDTIFQVIPIAKRTIYLRSSDVEKAIALIHANKRYIIYDEFFVEKIKENTNEKWAIYFVFAHELAHHLNAHGLDSTEYRLGTELEADKFAGTVLAKLGATQEQTLAAAEFFTEKDTDTHPRKTVRERQILIGWKNGRISTVPKTKLVTEVGLDRKKVSYADRGMVSVSECEFNRTGDYKVINNSSKDIVIYIQDGDDDVVYYRKSLQIKAGKTAYFYKLKALNYDYRVITKRVNQWTEIQNQDILTSGQIMVQMCYEQTMIISEE